MKIDIFLNEAEKMAKRSTCIRRQYGAVIVSNGTIIGAGYNGSKTGGEDNCSRVGRCPRIEQNNPHGSNYDNCPAVHAEINAILNAGADKCRGADMYLVGFENGKPIQNPQPCKTCRNIINDVGLKLYTNESVKRPKIIAFEGLDTFFNEKMILDVASILRLEFGLPCKIWKSYYDSILPETEQAKKLEMDIMTTLTLSNISDDVTGSTNFQLSKKEIDKLSNRLASHILDIWRTDITEENDYILIEGHIYSILLYFTDIDIIQTSYGYKEIMEKLIDGVRKLPFLQPDLIVLSGDIDNQKSFKDSICKPRSLNQRLMKNFRDFQFRLGLFEDAMLYSNLKNKIINYRPSIYQPSDYSYKKERDIINYVLSLNTNL